MTDLPPTQLRGAVDLSALVSEKRGEGSQKSSSGGVPVDSLVFDSDDAGFGQILELSRSVAIVVELFVGSPSATLERIILGFGGKLVLVRVDARLNPQLVQAFQAVAAPTVAAVIGGRPVALYEGELPEVEAKKVFDQVLVLAQQNGVNGAATVEQEGQETPDAPVEEPLPPHHQAAFDAIDRGDFASAIHEYRTAIAQDPQDLLAVAGLAQVSLLDRLQGTVAADIRSAAADGPDDVEAQLAVADLDVSGGHLDDAFSRLLGLFPRLDPPGRDAVRVRMLSYFEIAGGDDPRVVNARRALTSLLY